MLEKNICTAPFLDAHNCILGALAKQIFVKNCAPEIGGGTGEIFFQGETITNYVLQLYKNRDSGTGGFSVNFPKILIPPLQKCNFSKCVI